jgi:hypothetical protein
MTADVVASAVVLVALAAALTAAAGCSGVRDFAKRWAVASMVVAGFAAAGMLLGEIALSALCASVWICR